MKIWKRDYYEKLLGIDKLVTKEQTLAELQSEMLKLRQQVEEYRKMIEYIFVCNPYPDLSYHKYKTAFDILEEKAKKVLGIKEPEYGEHSDKTEIDPKKVNF